MERHKTIKSELARLKYDHTQLQYGKEAEYRSTKRLYFSLPKLNVTSQQPVIPNSSRQANIQLYKFPEQLLNGSTGFKRFKLLSPQGNTKPIEKVFSSVKSNQHQAKLYQRRFSEQKNSMIDAIQKQIVKKQQLAKHMKTISLNKPLLTSLKMKEAEVKVASKPPEYSEFLQNIIFPQYKKEMQRKHQQKLKEEEDVRQKYIQALVAKVKQNVINSYGQPPQCRQGCQIFNYNDKIYVFGGTSNNVRHTIQVLDLKNSHWDKLDIEGYRRRSFHNVLPYDIDKVLVVGGFKEAATNEKKRLATSFEIIDLEKKDLKILAFPKLKKIQPRYGQSASFIQNGILVISGGRTLQKYLNDCFIIDIDTGEVQKCKNLPYSEGLAHHTTCFADKTVYLFGGKTGDGQLTNKLFSFDLLSKQFKPVATHGKPPLQCYGHTMSYFAKHNVIFIYGGRNDLQETPFLNQIKLFHVGLSMYTDIPEGRIKEVRRKEPEEEKVRYCFAGSYNSESILYLYGGSNMDGFSNNITFFKFDMRLVPKI